MIVIIGALVLEDRVIDEGSLVIEGGRITAVESRPVHPAGAELVHAAGGHVVPGFIDVHVHGLLGHDVLDGDGAVRAVAGLLPRVGVTSFCPTSVACTPEVLDEFLREVACLRADTPGHAARVLCAHVESSFINPLYAGAQPAGCLRVPDACGAPPGGDFSTSDLLRVIEGAGPAVGVVTLAPELSGGLALVRTLASSGRCVSLGHSGADFETAEAAFDAGARHVTHLFNRLAPMTARAPGLIGAALARPDVRVELIGDGHHVHPAVCRMVMAAKGPRAVMAVTDATAGAGLPPGSLARLGGRRLRVGEGAAYLDDGTLAGGTCTMARVFRQVRAWRGSIVDAAVMCATTPARAVGRSDLGVLRPGAAADLVVLDHAGDVRRTMVDGVFVHGAMRPPEH